jgi:signal transduction histidine kinase
MAGSRSAGEVDAAASALRCAGEAALRSERLIVRGFTLIRTVTLMQSAASLIILWQHYRSPGLVVATLLAAMGESVLVVRIFRRQGSPRDVRVVAADFMCTMTFLTVTGTALKSSANPVTDNVLYPYSVAAMVVVAFGIRRWPGVVLIPAAAGATYVGLAASRFGFGLDLLANTPTYWAFAVIGWALAAKLRQLSSDLDDARSDAVARERELVRSQHAREVQRMRLTAVQADLDRETERTRTFRQLHDNVLQTLEFIARDDEIALGHLHGRVAAEAAWLRALVRGEAEPSNGDLSATLADITQRQAAVGLRVQLNVAAMAESEPLPRATAEALAGAVNEALTNVRKHAGTTRAVVRAAPSADGVLVTVLDDGCGFDSSTATAGFGMPASIRARIREVGGTVVISSAPGAGTHIELRVPRFGDERPGDRAAGQPSRAEEVPAWLSRGGT